MFFYTGSQDRWFGQAVNHRVEPRHPFSLGPLRGLAFGLRFCAKTLLYILKNITSPRNILGQIKINFGRSTSGVFKAPSPDRTETIEISYNTIKVAATKLSLVLNSYEIVHHVMMDIQGEEGAVLKECLEVANKKVRKFVIGTHSASIDKELAALFKKHRWESKWMFPCNVKNHPTPYGKTGFQDGVQVWRNPRIA